MFYDRYKKLVEISQVICDITNSNKYGLEWFDYGQNILFKIAGYNLNIDSMFRHIENKTLKSKLLTIPIINNLVIDHINQKFKNYEIKIIRKNRIKYESIIRYDLVCFLSMQTYFTAISSVIDSNIDKSILLILPREYKKWFNNKLIEKCIEENDLDVIYIDDFLFLESKIEIVNSVYNDFINNQKELSKILTFENINLFKAYKSSIEYFIKNFLANQVILSKNLFEYLLEITNEKTEFFIARDRRALENCFVQIGNKINGNTNLVMHGMISKNHDLRYITDGSFSNVNKIYAWGKHDFDTIQERQSLLKEKIPEIILGQYIFFKKIIKKESKYIVVALQGETIDLIPEFCNIKINGHKILLRFHPSNKNLIEKYKKYENEFIELDDLSSSLEVRLSEAFCFISFYSTAILESLYNEIPTFILNLNSLDKKQNIFLENKLNKDDEKIMFINSIEMLNKKIVNLKNIEIKNSLLNINSKLLRYFIRLEKKNEKVCM